MFVQEKQELVTCSYVDTPKLTKAIVSTEASHRPAVPELNTILERRKFTADNGRSNTHKLSVFALAFLTTISSPWSSQASRAEDATSRKCSSKERTRGQQRRKVSIITIIPLP
jgi:hypothetical protein